MPGGTRDPYAVLGVRPGATADEIHEAYARTAKRIHPDNFDKARQPDLWLAANAAQTELNEAYAALRTAPLRTSFEQTALAQEILKGWKPDWGVPDSDYAAFLGNHLDVAKLIAEVASAMNSTNELSRAVVLKQCHDILAQRDGQLRRAMAVWYYGLAVKTRGDAVATFNARAPSSGRATAVALIEQLCKMLNRAYELNSNARRLDPDATQPAEFEAKLRTDLAEARVEQHRIATSSHEVTQRGETHPDTPSSAKHRRFPGWAVALAIWAVIFGGAALLGSLSESHRSATPTWSPDASGGERNPRSVAAPSEPPADVPLSAQATNPSRIAPETKPAALPAVAIPANGKVWRNHSREEIAPLEIVTESGSGHFYVKLVNVTRERFGKWTLAVFIRSGQRTEIKMPLGTYELRYCSGLTWYGRRHLFGPETPRYKADEWFHFRIEGQRVAGYTVQLYKQYNGNLETSEIPAWQWGDDSEDGVE